MRRRRCTDRRRIFDSAESKKETRKDDEKVHWQGLRQPGRRAGSRADHLRLSASFHALEAGAVGQDRRSAKAFRRGVRKRHAGKERQPEKTTLIPPPHAG